MSRITMPSDPLVIFPLAGGGARGVPRSQVFDLLCTKLHRCVLVLRDGSHYPLGCTLEDAQHIRDGHPQPQRD